MSVRNTLLWAALSVLLPIATMAGPDRAYVMLGSDHLPGDRPARFNDATPGVFLTWENLRGSSLDLSLGAFINSYGDPSVAVSLSRLWPLLPGFEVGIFAGIATYPEAERKFAVHFGDLVPIAGVQARAGNLWLQFIPADGAYTSGVLSGGVTFEIGGRDGR